MCGVDSFCGHIVPNRPDAAGPRMESLLCSNENIFWKSKGRHGFPVLVIYNRSMYYVIEMMVEGRNWMKYIFSKKQLAVIAIINIVIIMLTKSYWCNMMRMAHLFFWRLYYGFLFSGPNDRHTLLTAFYRYVLLHLDFLALFCLFHTFSVDLTRSHPF